MQNNFGARKGPRTNDMTGDRRVQSQAPVHKKYILYRLWSYLSRYKGILLLAAVGCAQ